MTKRIVPCYFGGPRPYPHGKTNRFPIGALNSENGVVFYSMCVLPSQKLLSGTENTSYLEKSTPESSQNVSRVGTHHIPQDPTGGISGKNRILENIVFY